MTPEHPDPITAHPPRGQWARTWALTLLLAGLGLAGLETYWRSQGHVPSVVDDPELWSLHRGSVYQQDRPVVALLGMSRMELGFDLETFRQERPGYDAVQLAVENHNAFATLRDLAEDADFVGTVIYSLSFPWFRPGATLDQQSWVDHYHHRSTLDARLNRRAATQVQSSLALINPIVSSRAVLEAMLRQGKPPRPFHIMTRPDRSRAAFYRTRVPDLDLLRDGLVDRLLRRYERPWVPNPTPDESLRQAQALEPLIQKLQARGCDVLFVRFPTDGPVWETEERLYPRADYWDRFAAGTGAETLHFRDAPALASFRCPDHSHLDAEDAPAFTSALLREIANLGLIHPETSPPNAE